VGIGNAHYDRPVTSGVKAWFASRYASETWRSVLVIVLVVILANGAFVIFGYETSPVWWTAGISSRVCLWTCGIPTVDPNVGFITQPLGHLAAMDWLHGHLPWWNYFEGMGQPLAGEMQSSALLPLVVLFIFPAGLLMFHLSLQIIAGVSTYFLIRRLGVGATFATLGGVLFALNGTFAWIGNAAINPIAFLPMMILGIEIVVDRSSRSRRGGWTVLAIAVALSIYAGFPEMAYLDGLLAGGWAVTRLFSVERPRRVGTLVRLALGSGVGVALSLPVLIAFADFLKDANVGAHAAKGLSIATTAPGSLPMLVNPYLSGALFGGSKSTPNNLLGYFTASVAVFALVGVIGPRLRPLRWFLTAWTLAVLAGVLNLLEVRRVWNLIPYMKEVAFARYVWPTAEFAVIILAVMGLSDIVEYAARRRPAKWAALGVVLVAVIGIYSVTPLGGLTSGSIQVGAAVLILVPFVVLAVLGFGLQFVDGRAFSRLVVAVIAIESLAYFAVPTYRSPTSITVDTGSISYLQQNLGTARFVSLGVLNPNWGSQYSISEINAIDLPLPQNFSNYIKSNLAPTIKNPRIFILPFTVANQNEIAAHITNYEALGVAYLLAPRKTLTPALSGVGLTPVAHDANTVLYRLSNPAAFYTTALSTCTLTQATVDHVEVNCPDATTLTRRELSMSGWRAHVNGTVVPIVSPDGLTQTISLPAGISKVSFDFLPPHEGAAVAVAGVGFLAMASTWIPRRRRWPRVADVENGASDDDLEVYPPLGGDPSSAEDA
jgi:hypothetical protein